MKSLCTFVLILLFISVSAQREKPYLAVGMGTGGVSVSAYRQLTHKFSAGVSVAHLNSRTDSTAMGGRRKLGKHGVLS